MKNFNGLSPAETERLALLSEEMGEVQQAIGKILRHGYESIHPDGGRRTVTILSESLGMYNTRWNAFATLGAWTGTA